MIDDHGIDPPEREDDGAGACGATCPHARMRFNNGTTCNRLHDRIVAYGHTKPLCEVCAESWQVVERLRAQREKQG